MYSNRTRACLYRSPTESNWVVFSHPIGQASGGATHVTGATGAILIAAPNKESVPFKDEHGSLESLSLSDQFSLPAYANASAVVAAAKAAKRQNQSGTGRSKSDVRDSRSKDSRNLRNRDNETGRRSKSSARANTKMCLHNECNVLDSLSNPTVPSLGEPKPSWRFGSLWLRRSLTILWRRRQSSSIQATFPSVSAEHESLEKFCSEDCHLRIHPRAPGTTTELPVEIVREGIVNEWFGSFGATHRPALCKNNPDTPDPDGDIRDPRWVPSRLCLYNTSAGLLLEAFAPPSVRFSRCVLSPKI
ncbi:unnamed protein product [Echinostoma caproni]|uniref:Uncharacterized protein n=1 Tax=Echinostoma caproni TaxID=27848 RepID=A0A183B610_9TREM|nr:unnamed protein product [Echinostoma caproni]